MKMSRQQFPSDVPSAGMQPCCAVPTFRQGRRKAATVYLLFALGAARLAAGVVGVEIAERIPLNEVAALGSAGAYERLVGTIRFALDPRAPANSAIRDLGLAQTDASGRVLFSATFDIVRPVDAAKGNGTMLLEISNRGGKAILSRFCYGRAQDAPRTREDFGDAWLLQQGFTLAWVGWQWDVPAAKPLRLHPAKLKDPHARGLVRAEFVPDRDAPSMPLGDRDHEPIALAEALRLAVRSTPDEPARELSPASWRVAPDGKSVLLDGGFQGGLLYEFVYRGKEGVVSGLSLAAIRDFVSFAKHGGRVAGDLGRTQRVIGFGISQTGRFLRHFLHEGFNADEQGRRVFDGVWSDVAGAGRGSFNHRYAQASRDGNPWTNVFYPTDVFPFHDRETRDPVAGRSGALLAAAEKAGVTPKIFYTNSSYEYWGRVAALIHVSPDGKTDVPLAPSTRVYFIAGAQHGPGAIPPLPRSTRFPVLPTDHRPLQRALLHALQRWVADNEEPPASAYPQLANGTLIPAAEVAFPRIEGLPPPRFPRVARRLDLGEDFEREGILTDANVTVRGAFPLLVPAADADGNDRAGLRMPQVAVPLGTYAGWNFRSENAAEHMANFMGSFVPLAKTEAERRAKGDARPAIAERYRDRDDFLARASQVADRMVAARLLLAIDRERAVQQCAQLWDVVMK